MKKNKIIIIPLVLLFTYLVIVTIGCIAQTSMIFHPKKLDSNYHYDNEYSNREEVFITTPDNEKINGLFFNAKNDNVILYFHGNSGSLDSWQYVYKNFQSLKYNFFIIDYRGYGKSSGSISEKGLYTDGQAALDYLRNKGFKKQNIIIYGRSIGTGIAVETAKNTDTLKALILETPFTSMIDLTNAKVPYLFPSIFLKYGFKNKDKINSIKSPLLVIHGTIDEVIPFKQGKELFDKYNHQKEFLKIENGNHNNLSNFPDFIQGIMLFLYYIDTKK